MGIRSARGAITVMRDEGDEILSATKELLSEIITRNQFKHDDVISIIFTATKDLTKVYPAAAARELGFTSAALMCAEEMRVEGSLPMCVRACVTAECGLPQRDIEHVYLREATRLRPDLARARRRGAVAIAIDGPGGAGKSTLAKMVAEALGFVYVDTGAMYRAAALYCMRKGIDLSDGSLLARRLQSVEAVLDSMDLEIKFVDGAQKIFLCGGDVTEAIRDSAVGTGASQVSVIPAVREKLVALQRKLAQDCDVVMDGRDIGTHVLPNARLKIYLDADLKTRVTRRLKDLREKGREAESVEVERELRERDHRDMTRDASPLCKADDAVVLDTSNLTREEAREKIIELFRRGSEFSLRENGLTAGSLEVTRNVL